MQSIPITDVYPNSVARTDYYSDKGMLLISRGTVITKLHLDTLTKRNNLDLFFKPDTDEEEVDQLLAKGFKKIDELDLDENGRNRKSRREAGRERPVTDLCQVKPGRNGLLQLVKSDLVRALDENVTRQADRPIGQPLKNKSSPVLLPKRIEIYKEEVAGSYESALQDTEKLLRLIVTGRNVDVFDVARIVRRFVQIFITDRNILLNIAGSKPSDGDYLFHHSLNVCLLSINVAASYGYSEKQVLEIGMGALLHDIGMLQISEAIRTKPGRLNEYEWYEVQKHPIIALYLLQKMKNLPERVPYIVYQVHERENSTGYPRQHSGLLVHRFAKMVQVADVYEALTAPRPHRLPLLMSEAIAKLLKMSEKGLIACDAVHAFLEYVSLFPVGSLVELDDHSVAKVVHANKNAFRHPVVSVLTDPKNIPLPKDTVRHLDLSKNRHGIQIVRELPRNLRKNFSLMDGF